MAALDPAVCKRTYGNLAAAGTTAVTSAIVDMAGFDELVYQIVFGDNTSGSVVTIAAYQNTVSHLTVPTPTTITLSLGISAAALGTAAVITSGNLVVTAGATDTDNKIVLVTLKKSVMTKQYQWVSVTPATQNAVIASITVEQRSSRSAPVTQSTSVIATAYAAA